ncbi:hypothetical protein SLS61_003601 [Didymella pomorum]
MATLLYLTAEVKEQQKLVKDLHKTEKATCKIYIRARAKLLSKKHHDLHDKETKKWYSLWVNSVAELQALMASTCLQLLGGRDQIKQQETALFELKERRANQVAQDRENFERELLQH